MAASSKETKKPAILYIYKILSEQTDSYHPLKHEEIAAILKEKYGIQLERKAIGRDLKIIREAGFDLRGEGGRTGSYLARDYEPGELLFLIECVRSSPSIRKRYAEDLIAKIADLSAGGIDPSDFSFEKNNRHFGQNADFFRVIEQLQNAVRQKRLVSFDYSVSDRAETSGGNRRIIGLPCKLLMNGGILYLAAIVPIGNPTLKNWYGYILRDYLLHLFRVDQMRDLTEHAEESSYQKSTRLLNANDFVGRMNSPQVFFNPDDTGEHAERITFLCPEEKVTAVLDYFGDPFSIEKTAPLSPDAIDSPSWKFGHINERMLKVTLYTTKTAMTEFAFRHGPYILILSPDSLRESIQLALRDMSAVQSYAGKLANDPERR